MHAGLIEQLDSVEAELELLAHHEADAQRAVAGAQQAMAELRQRASTVSAAEACALLAHAFDALADAGEQQLSAQHEVGGAVGTIAS